MTFLTFNASQPMRNNEKKKIVTNVAGINIPITIKGTVDCYKLQYNL